MSSNSKNKGSSFEREVAKYLSSLYAESFVRAAHSGAYVGGINARRKEYLSESQIKSFKGDIIPPDSWINFNCECKSYADFPFHLLYAGDCKVIDSWIKQMMDVAEADDVSILIIKITRKGKFVAVQSSLTWITDNFTYYSSKSLGDWIIIEFEQFFKLNRDLLKTYSSGKSTDTMSRNLNQAVSTDTMSK